ncbi:MAG: tetratricopeptide repeat protein [Psychromonas sp.]|nr:tetratricopeptide repeat protein [Psychromonas sp.]
MTGKPTKIMSRKRDFAQQLKLKNKQADLSFQKGLDLHMKGELAQAKVIYEKVLTQQSDHFNASHLLGVIAIQSNQLVLALDLFSKAIKINPNVADVFCNQGIALMQLNRLEEALASYNNAISLKADHVEAYMDRAITLQKLNRLNDSLASYDEILAINPDHIVALIRRGILLQNRQRSDEALSSFNQVIAIQPDHVEALTFRGIALQDLKRFEAALIDYGKVITIQPEHVKVLIHRGIAFKSLKRFDEALADYDKAITIDPNCAQAFINRGVTLKLLNRLDEALVMYNRAIAINSDDAGAYYNRGNVQIELNLLDDALMSYAQTIAINPNYTQAFFNSGIVLSDLMRLDEALINYDKAIFLKPDYAQAFVNRGVTLNQLNRFDEALVSFNRAIAIDPNVAESFYNRGNLLQETKQFEKALASYNKAIAIKPDYAAAFYNRGNALQDLKRLDDALASYNKVNTIKPDFADAFHNRAVTLAKLNRLNDALIFYDKAIAIEPHHVEALTCRGNTLAKLNHLDEALASYNKAFAINPDTDFLFGIKLHTQMKLCDWTDISGQLSQVSRGIVDGTKLISPFPLLGLIDDPALQLSAAKMYVDTLYPVGRLFDDFSTHKANEKIRIGYYSADFHNHATAYLMAEFFEAHDAIKFEIYGFSFGANENDEMRQRVAVAFDYFYDVTNKSDAEVTKMSRDLGIDIAVDLKGFTQHARIEIFAQRCAPIQVNYLGYPGTMGAAYIDYIIADKILIPEESQQYYSEKIVYLPNSYQVNDAKRKVSDKILTRKDAGLPENAFIFCCFNNNYKILPTTFDGWIRILKAVDHSVLWLLECNATAVKYLCKAAQSRGVNPSRLIFAKRMKLEDHLARHQLADLFIDTLPCNAHTTASDALWSGLPVLTLIGKSFAGRVAASLLNAMDLPELITDTQAQYEAKAIELADDPALLVGINQKLQRNRLTSSLFNGQLFARNLEKAFTQMSQRYQSGMVPEHIYPCDIKMLCQAQAR